MALSTMFNSFKRQWKSLRRSRPGHRFKDRYARNQQTKKSKSIVGRIVRLGVALVSFVIGVVLVFIPGPAIVFFALTGALLAGESLLVARALDWTELRVRSVVNLAKRHWRKLHLPAKAAIVSFATLATSGAMYASYRVFMH